MKKFVFAIFTLMAVGLFTNPLFAKFCDKAPECAASCSWMQTCLTTVHTSNYYYDIYDCGDKYAAIDKSNCYNCRWDVEMKGGKFFVDSNECKPW